MLPKDPFNSKSFVTPLGIVLFLEHNTEKDGFMSEYSAYLIKDDGNTKLERIELEEISKTIPDKNYSRILFDTYTKEIS